MRGNAQCSSSTHDGEHREYYGTSKEQRKKHQYHSFNSSEGAKTCINHRIKKIKLDKQANNYTSTENTLEVSF
jgi:hypothetical protein